MRDAQFESTRLGICILHNAKLIVVQPVLANFLRSDRDRA
jgi:hypothetical protein